MKPTILIPILILSGCANLVPEDRRAKEPFWDRIMAIGDANRPHKGDIICNRDMLNNIKCESI